MKRLPVLALMALLAACKHGHCGSDLPTDPGQAAGVFNCGNSAYCASLRQPGDPETRCYSPSEDGSATTVCMRPGPACITSADCHTGSVCVVSIEVLSGRFAQPPVRTCQSTRNSCGGSSGFDPGANFR